jgi:hypothetical protein
MGWQIVKNPETNDYQVFSSIVDGFITDHEYTREELTEFWLQQFGERGQQNFKRILEELDKPDGKPYHQFTITWAEAIMMHTHSEKHGDKYRPTDCQRCREILADIAKEEKANGKK